MNKLFLSTLIILNCTLGLAQKHDSRTHEKEITYSGQGKITLETGVELTGTIYYSHLTQFRVKIKNIDGTSKIYKGSEAKSFSIDGTIFEKVTTPNMLTSDLSFAILLSNPSSTIRVYEVCWQEEIAIGYNAENDLWPTYREYYAYFPSLKDLKAFANIAFVPFAKKVSALVEDCPEVSNKIKAKEKGYAIGLMSTDADKLNVFINIANAYSNCK